LTGKRWKDFDASDPYRVAKVVAIIPLGQKWNAIEKLFYPFQTTFWLLILIFGLFGFLVIFIISRRSKTVQNFVFGRNVKNPTLNLFIGFIGGSQTILPGKNFARFLLMIFLMYSLVIRTLYQGSYFKLLQ
jgi:hypothetical protein